MSALPVRVRVTLAFTLAMAVLLGALGAFLYLQLRSDLDETLNDNLQSRLAEVTGLVASSAGITSGGEAELGAEDETFVQVLDATGDVVFASAVAGEEPLIGEADIPPVGSAPLRMERDSLPTLDGGARLLVAAPTDVGDPAVVVGASLDDRDETLARLATLLLIGGSAALLLTSLAGYWAAGRALGPIEAALERERRFVDDASHELRTPLALHRAELELAIRYGDDPAELRNAIASAIEEVDRLVALAEALLVVARSGEGGLALANEEVTVGDLFETVITRFRARSTTLKRPIVAGDGAGLTIRGDRLRLEQALTGLVDNALRHGDGTVRLWAESSAGAVALHVTDEGEGFPDAFIAHAFERFTRADAARPRGGAGLGLAIVDTIATAHGGSAKARNLQQGGADVSFTVPADTVSSE